MRIGAISNQSFKGLWEVKKEKELNTITHNYHGAFYSVEGIYHPFKDETKAEIDENIAKYDNQIIGCDDDRVLDPYGFDSIHFPKVEVGEKLNVTKAEYEKMATMRTEMFPNTYCFTYQPVDESEKDELRSWII